MKLTFIGIGGAFDIDNFNSNMVIEMEPQELIQMNRKDTIPRRLMIDCGFTAPFALREAGIDPLTISGLYVSHQHSDHIGGTEYYAFKTYFSPHGVKPKIIASAELLEKLWNDSLRGGLGSLQGKIANMNTYFEPEGVLPNSGFEWDGIWYQLVQTVHVMNGYSIVPSYGLFFASPKGKKVFITTDTQFCPNQIKTFYDMADIIFHDCELGPFRSDVHAHYEDLKTLPELTKNKMWLYHYNSKLASDYHAANDGFAGFVEKGQTFDL